LSDAEIEAILDRNDRDERGEVPAPEDLVSHDELFELGLITPAAYFLEKRMMGCRDPEKLEGTFRHAVRDLLRSNIPLDQLTRNLIASRFDDDRDPKAEGRRLHLFKAKLMCRDFEVTVAANKRKGVPHPEKEARAELARHWGYQNGEAFRKALQPSRAGHHRPRR
jgi:hypothetical protein